MAPHKEIGKIARSTWGLGGYQDAQLGWSLTFSGKGWGSGTFEGHWAHRPAYAEWTVEQQEQGLGKAALKMYEAMKTAGVSDVTGLVGVPVEVIFDGMGGRMISWRVLEEVL